MVHIDLTTQALKLIEKSSTSSIMKASPFYRIYQDEDSLLTELARSAAEIGNQAQLQSNRYSTNP
jgi:hypothetical protein